MEKTNCDRNQQGGRVLSGRGLPPEVSCQTSRWLYLPRITGLKSAGLAGSVDYQFPGKSRAKSGLSDFSCWIVKRHFSIQVTKPEFFSTLFNHISAQFTVHPSFARPLLQGDCSSSAQQPLSSRSGKGVSSCGEKRLFRRWPERP